jgi:hypothetical protein
MNVVRGLEKRLERLLEGVAGRVFSGRLHPSEIAGRLAREADFARFDHETGPATANAFSITVNKRDLEGNPVDLEAILVGELRRYTAEHGLRLEGPVLVRVATSPDVARGSVVCHAEVSPGPQPAWAKLVSGETSHEVAANRVLIGRTLEVDVRLPYEEISRRHALVWREGGRVWLRDLGSANGTTIDGVLIGDDPVELERGNVVAFAGHSFRWVPDDDA